MSLIFFISPHFINRYYLLHQIASILERYSFKGTVLDVGCGQKPYRKLFGQSTRYEGIDFKIYSKNKGYREVTPDHYFPKNYQKNWRLPFSKESFDNVVSFQVIEHHPKPKKMISEMVKVVKQGGYILITAPFIWSMHEKPNDFYRLTPYALERIFRLHGCQNIKIKKIGSLFSVICSLATDYLIETANKNLLFYIICLVVYPIFLTSSYMCLVLDRIFKSEDIFLNTLILARKR